MELNLKLLKQLVTDLRACGFEATCEYPGYIAIGERAYGTANGLWGWSDADGNGCDSLIPENVTNTNEIKNYILTVERSFLAEKVKVTKAYGSDEEYLEDVASHIKLFQEGNDLGIYPEVSHTGGGIYNLAVMIGERVQLRFGTCDTTWGADVYVDGEWIDGESFVSNEIIEENRPGNAATVLIRLVDTFRCEKLPVILEKLDKEAKLEAAERGFREAISQFYDAASFVNRMWGSLPAESEYLNMPTKAYPFNESFEEVHSKIGKWLESVKRD